MSKAVLKFWNNYYKKNVWSEQDSNGSFTPKSISKVPLRCLGTFR